MQDIVYIGLDAGFKLGLFFGFIGYLVGLLFNLLNDFKRG